MTGAGWLLFATGLGLGCLAVVLSVTRHDKRRPQYYLVWKGSVR